MVKLSPRYGSHLPVLLQALAKTSGPVLELGMGVTSTPLLSAWCNMEQRELWSFDNYSGIWAWAKDRYGGQYYHTMRLVSNWDDALIDRPWDVALVDHSPSERRVTEIKRLAHLAKYIVIHDSNGRYEREYHYFTIYPLFKHKLDWNGLEPSTTVLSNLVSLDDFWGTWKTHSIIF